MKKLLAVCLTVLGLGLHAQLITERIAQMEQKEVRDITSGTRAAGEGNTNVIYARLQLEVDPAVNFISGLVTTVFIATTDINSFEFDLSDSLTVDSVHFRNAGIAFIRQGGHVVHLNLPVTISTGQTDSITVF